MRSQKETIQKHQKRGKTWVTKTQLVLDLNLIGGGKEARFLERSKYLYKRLPWAKTHHYRIPPNEIWWMFFTRLKTALFCILNKSNSRIMQQTKFHIHIPSLTWCLLYCPLYHRLILHFLTSREDLKQENTTKFTSQTINFQEYFT